MNPHKTEPESNQTELQQRAFFSIFNHDAFAPLRRSSFSIAAWPVRAVE